MYQKPPAPGEDFGAGVYHPGIADRIARVSPVGENRALASRIGSGPMPLIQLAFDD